MLKNVNFLKDHFYKNGTKNVLIEIYFGSDNFFF